MEHKMRGGDYRAPFWPGDFQQRLERLMDLDAMLWQELAELLGVTEGSVIRWHSGEGPAGPNFWTSMGLDRILLGGYELILRIRVESGREAE